MPSSAASDVYKRQINKSKSVLPKPEINSLIQNRLTEKDFLNKNNIRTTNYALIKNKDEIKDNENLLPGLLKTTTLGYDGKGQYKLNSLKDINEGIDFTKEYILEKFINLKKEISIVICRFGNQKYEIYEPIENVHEDQILKHSKIPAEVSETIKVKSKEWAKQIVEELDYIGTLCVEFFIDKNENLEKYIDLLQSIKSKILESPIHTFTASSIEKNNSQINFDFEERNGSNFKQKLFDIQTEKIGWITGAQVCYCAETFPTVDMKHEDAAALTVLGAVLRNGYLHSAIREKGGAYGAGAMQDIKNKVFKFFSPSGFLETVGGNHLWVSIPICVNN